MSPPNSAEPVPKRRLVILGGGHAGVAAARRLSKRLRSTDRAEVVLISAENVETMHGLMPQVLSSMVQPQTALLPLRTMLSGVRIQTSRVERIDLAERRLWISRGDEREQYAMEYAYLVLALGSVTDLSRLPGLSEHGLQVKTMGDIFYLRNHLIEMLERGSSEDDRDERRRLLTFVVAGAGFSGVEIASQVNGLIRDSLKFYPSIDRSEVRVVLLSRATRILPALSDALAARAVRHLRRSGIDLRLGVGLRAATATSAIFTNGEQLSTRTIIATVGLAANPLVTTLPIAFTRGRITCDDYCRVPGWPGVYAIGDNAAIPHPKTHEPCPPTALYAFAQGKQAADNVLAELRHSPLKRYHYDRIGELSFLGRNDAVATLKGVPLSGLIAVVVGRSFFLNIVPTWHRRVLLMFDWLMAAAFPRDIAQMRIARTDTILPMRFGAGEEIIRQGEQGSRLYIIADGAVEVVRHDAEGHETRLATLGAGDYFGEIALLHDVKRTATVRATCDTKVLSIAREDFSTLVEHLPALRTLFERTPASGQAASPPPV